MYNVFLADDEPWVLLGLKNMINWGDYGFTICGEATDGQKAWERISHLHPDLIISDIRMPGLSGIELLKRVRESLMQAEWILISGYTEFEYAKAGLQLGCMDYLVKPIYEENLIECLEKARIKLQKEDTKDLEKDFLDEQDEMGYLSEKRIVKEMFQYMKEHYQNLTQQQLAETFCMSTSAVSQMIKRYTGKTYSDNLLDVRIQKAQDLLRKTNKSIEQIAEETGYNDYFYFVKVFKKATGISPTNYRKNL